MLVTISIFTKRDYRKTGRGKVLAAKKKKKKSETEFCSHFNRSEKLQDTSINGHRVTIGKR